MSAVVDNLKGLLAEVLVTYFVGDRTINIFYMIIA